MHDLLRTAGAALCRLHTIRHSKRGKVGFQVWRMAPPKVAAPGASARERGEALGASLSQVAHLNLSSKLAQRRAPDSIQVPGILVLVPPGDNCAALLP